MKSLVVLAVVGLFGSAACGREPAPQRPASDLLRRSASKIELVEFVVTDPARAERVKGLYVEVETLLRELERERLDRLRRLTEKGPTEPDDESIRSELRAFSQSEKRALERYFDLQIKLRKQLHEDEFARLNELR